MPGKPEQLLRRSTQLEGSQGSQACGQGRLWSGVATHPFRWGPQRLGKWLCEQCLTLFLANSATPYTSPPLTPTDHIFCPPPPKNNPDATHPVPLGSLTQHTGQGRRGGGGF
ncbi:mCG147283 [Mus musculus]|nr:mCG147283 [Mus musculus]